MSKNCCRNCSSYHHIHDTFACIEGRMVCAFVDKEVCGRDCVPCGDFADKAAEEVKVEPEKLDPAVELALRDEEIANLKLELSRLRDLVRYTAVALRAAVPKWPGGLFKNVGEVEKLIYKLEDTLAEKEKK